MYWKNPFLRHIKQLLSEFSESILKAVRWRRLEFSNLQLFLDFCF